MRTALKNLFLLFPSFLIVACNQTSPERQGLPETFKYASVEAKEISPTADPKVNILFVVDNSGSMKPYQDLMAKNIEKFAEKFFANTRIDYRIGVVPIYDSVYLNDTTVYRSGLRKMNPLGELVPLKGLPENYDGAKLYMTRDTPNVKEVLKKTVKIGTQWGPEAEESFSPVLAIANARNNAEKNDNFFQEDAYLAVIFLTDADDNTPGLSPEDFYQKLLDLKGGDRSKVLIAAAIPVAPALCVDRVHGEKIPNKNFPSLLARSGGITADLCSNSFGEKLAQFGTRLNHQVGTQKISIGFDPDVTTLKVTYGVKGDLNQQVIPRSLNGFMFDSYSKEIILSSDLKLERIKDAVITVTAKPINAANFRNNRLKKSGE